MHYYHLFKPDLNLFSLANLVDEPFVQGKSN